MPRRTFTDLDALDGLLKAGERIARHHELVELGMPKSTITWRIRPDGPWQRLLPGVVLAHRGLPTARERLLGALKYAGESSLITGMPALAEHGVAAARRTRSRPHLLVAHDSRRNSHSFVVIERTRRMPAPVHRGLLRLAPIPRAVIDAARREENLDRVREIVAEVVQEGRCTAKQLLEELQKAARQRTALSRAVLREIEAGIRSVAEAKVRAALRARGVDDLDWNVLLYTPDGDFVAQPDAYCRRTGVALQVDSIQWHLRPAGYRRTQQRQRDLAGWGVYVLPWSPVDALNNPDEVVSGIVRLRELGTQRPVPQLVVRRPDE